MSESTVNLTPAESFSVFGFTSEVTLEYIAWCDRQDAIEADRREHEAAADRDFIRRCQAADAYAAEIDADDAADILGKKAA